MAPALAAPAVAASLGIGRTAHQAAHLHQVEIDKRKVAGVRVDINHILKPRFGLWD